MSSVDPGETGVTDIPANSHAGIAAAVERARALRNSDPTQGIRIAEGALAAAQRLASIHPDDLPAQRLLADALAALGHCERMSSSLADAAQHSSAAVSVYEAIGEQRGEAMARTQWGIALVQMGDLTGGLAQLERSRDISVALGDRRSESDALIDIGVVHNMLGDDASAIAFYQQALPIYEQANDTYHVATCLNNMAYAHVCWGRRELDGGRADSASPHFSQASLLAARALPLARVCDHVDFVATCLNTLSLARRHSGDLDGCMAALREQLAISEQIVGHRVRAVCRATIADALLQRNNDGDASEALHLLTEADEICAAHQLRESHPPIVESLALALERSGDMAAALAAHRRFHSLQMQINSETAEREARALESRLRLVRTEADLDSARLREQELATLNAQLNAKQAELERLAHIDPLTGLANRRAWLQELASEWAAGQQGLYLLLLDIDHFKSINDSWGHAVGDAVLQRVARCVVGSIGEPRATGRFGGEEFVAWCRVDSRETMAALAARTLQAIRQSNWDEIGVGLRVTASLGWTAATRHASVDAALSEADRRMYDAKHAGRDQAMG